MGNANIVELNQCLLDCVQYCEVASQTDYVQEYCQPLANALKDLHDSIGLTDRYFAKWSTEMGEDKLAWKHVAKELAHTQTMLRKVNAIGFPEEKVMYWDIVLLQEAVQKMLGYLEQRREHLPFAAEQIEKIDRLLAKSAGEDIETGDALKDYKRFIQLRSNAIINASKVIGEFRVAMRRDLGRENQEYKSIRWPFSVAPDEYVL